MYASKINLAVLQKIPHKIVKTKLVVEPLAPLSMVSEMPGSFYKTLNVPSKKNDLWTNRKCSRVAY